MKALPRRPPRDTGPIELRGFGPMGRRLGTVADCYDGSPWELHRGELVEQMGSLDIHAIVMALVTGLFLTHARAGLTVMTDVYCDLSDAAGPSLRAPDVVLVRGLSQARNAAYRGTPVLAVEVRGTQSKRYLEEKVKLYLDHDWPWVWIVHAERHEVEIVRAGTASVTYRPGAEVPLLPELDEHDLHAVPVAAFFDKRESDRFTSLWVKAQGEAQGKAQGEAHGRAKAVTSVLAARGLAIPDAVRARVEATTDLALVDRWLVVAATCASADAFVRALG